MSTGRGRGWRRRADLETPSGLQAHIAARCSACEDGCWRWTARLNAGGYGVASVPIRGETLAHRIAYTAWIGPIPLGLHLDHLCRVRSCVNPDHLEAVPKLVNDLRGFSPTGINARKTHCVRGHQFTPENTQYGRQPKSGRSRRACRACKRTAQSEYEARLRNAKRSVDTESGAEV